MSTTNSEIRDRTFWENKIVEFITAIIFDKPDWYLSEEYNRLIESLRGLRDYYAISNDTLICLEPIGNINKVIKIFARDISDPNLTSDVRDQAAWELARFQSFIDDFVTEAVMNLYDL